MRGFTLIEVVTSLLILSVAILLFMVLHGVTLKFSREARLNEEMVALARSDMETVSSMDFDDVSSKSYVVTTPSGASCTVSRTVESISSNTKKVSVTVSCEGRSVELSTVVSER